MSSALYSVVIKRSAQKTFSALPRAAQVQIAERLVELETNPFPVGCKKITGLSDTWRVRAGNYRILYEVHANTLVVVVIRIGHRKEIYRKL